MNEILKYRIAGIVIAIPLYTSLIIASKDYFSFGVGIFAWLITLIATYKYFGMLRRRE